MMLLPEMRIPLQSSITVSSERTLNLPSCSEDGESEGNGNAEVGPGVRISAVEHILPSGNLVGGTGVFHFQK